MSKCVISCVPAVSAGLFVAVIVLGANRTAVAADDCLAGPDRPPAAGGHWYYHLDHASDRKCWYLVEPAARAPTAEAVQPQPAPDAAADPAAGFRRVFLDPVGGISRVDRNPAPHHPMHAARKPLRLTISRIQKPRRLAISTRPAARPRWRRSPPSRINPHTPGRRPSMPTDGPAAAPDQAERDALFQEFLRWRERQTP